MQIESVLCEGTNMDGTRCTRHKAGGRTTCRWHHPEVVEARARALEEQAARLRGNVPA